MIRRGGIFGAVPEVLQTGRKGSKVLFVARTVNQEEFVFTAGARQCMQQVADVGAYTEIGNAPAIDGDFHGTGVRRHG